MTTTVHAIYEQGSLKLKEPVSLREGDEVEVVIISPEPEPASPAQILARIAALPGESNAEDFSNRDHDQVLYGEGGAR